MQQYSNTQSCPLITSLPGINITMSKLTMLPISKCVNITIFHQNHWKTTKYFSDIHTWHGTAPVLVTLLSSSFWFPRDPDQISTTQNNEYLYTGLELCHVDVFIWLQNCFSSSDKTQYMILIALFTTEGQWDAIHCWNKGGDVRIWVVILL